MTFETLDYSAVWQGCLPLSRVEWHFDPNARLHLSAFERRNVEQYWEGLKQNQSWIEDLPLYRLLGFEDMNGGLKFELGLTGYKEYVGTNVSRPQWALANPNEKMANPLPISVVAVTGDKQVPMQIRSSAAGSDRGKWHVTPCGNTHPPHSLEDAVLMELVEELAVNSEEIVGPILLTGVVVDKHITKPELTLLLHLRPSWEDILSRSAIDSWEYERLEPLGWDSDVVGDWLIRNERSCVPPGHAALMLGGRVQFGDAWMNNIVGALG